jgi:hypothetical protein
MQTPLCATCDAVTRNDSEFSRSARMYGMEKYRFVCLNGHSTYVPEPLAPEGRRMKYQHRYKHTYVKHKRGYWKELGAEAPEGGLRCNSPDGCLPHEETNASPS